MADVGLCNLVTGGPNWVPLWALCLFSPQLLLVYYYYLVVHLARISRSVFLTAL